MVETCMNVLSSTPLYLSMRRLYYKTPTRYLRMCTTPPQLQNQCYCFLARPLQTLSALSL